MDIKKIKEAYKNLPHVVEIWVKNNEVYLVELEGTVRYSLTDTTEDDEIVSEDKPQTKKIKNKK
jgi:hypothetical protein